MTVPLLVVIATALAGAALRTMTDLDLRVRTLEVAHQNSADMAQENARDLATLSAEVATLQAQQILDDKQLDHLGIRQDAVEADLKADEAMGILRRGRK